MSEKNTNTSDDGEMTYSVGESSGISRSSIHQATEDDDCLGPNIISQMPNDILLKILSFLPLKTAVITGSLSKRWRFVWPYLKRLDFDGSEAPDETPCVDQAKYINQVNSVVGSHLSPTLQLFRIGFNLDKKYVKDLDNWLRFALDRKVEILELDLRENHQRIRDPKENYDFPLPLSDGSMARFPEWPPSNSMDVETLSLKKLVLLSVNISEPALSALLKHSPSLEKLYIVGSGLLTAVNAGGFHINLKQLILMACTGLRSITLHDFDLEKFQYIGRDIDFHLANLSKVKELDLGQVSVGLNNKVFSAIACLASTLEVLSLDVSRQAEDIERDAPGFPLLPNVKTLTLTLPTEVHDTITEFIEIGKKCPSLEIFKISLYWCASITKEKAWYTPFGFDFIRLKHV